MEPCFVIPRKSPTGTKVLAAAEDLFYSRGIQNVGVDLIADVAGTTKRTVYDQFSSKGALVAAYLEARAARWQEFILATLETQTARAGQRERVATLFEAAEAWSCASPRRGCAFVNAQVEIADPRHPAMAVIAREKAWMRALCVSLVGGPAEGTAESIGLRIHLVYEGFLVLSSIGAAEVASREAAMAAFAILDAGEPSAL